MDFNYDENEQNRQNADNNMSGNADMPDAPAPMQINDVQTVVNANLDEKKKSKTPVIAGIVALFAIVGAISFVMVSGVFASPAKQLMAAKKSSNSHAEKVINNAMSKLSTSNVQFPEKTEMDYSLTIKNLSGGAEGVPLFLLNNSRLEGNALFDVPGRKADMALQLIAMGKSIATLDLNLDDTYLSAGMKELYSKYLSVDFSTLNEDIKASPLTKDANTPEYDFSGVPDKIFGYPKFMNDIMTMNNEANEEYKGLFIGEGLEVDDSKIEKGEKEKVGDYSCTIYTTTYDGETINKYIKEYADIYINYNERYMKALTEYFDVDEHMLGSDLGNIRQDIMKVVDGIGFSKPVAVKYYIDDKKNIRRIVTDFDIVIKGDESESTGNGNVDISFLGKDNIYDVLALKAAINDKDNGFTMTVEGTSDGIHGDAKVFKDSSELTVTASDGTIVTIRDTINYDSETDRIDAEIEINEPTTGDMVLGFTGSVKVDENAGTMNCHYDEIYVNAPDAEMSFAASFDLGPLTTEPKSKTDFESVEILKMNQEQLDAMSQEIQKNAESFTKNIMSLFGM